jgi:hypothetical protein
LPGESKNTFNGAKRRIRLTIWEISLSLLNLFLKNRKLVGKKEKHTFKEGFYIINKH